ncbi:hypothetical protein C8F04DRAFT_1227154 [Mycena alexandri]|uniref:Uncharacterized protein n=1 Tax=Mycena alexandri TaxID=1745969 RepID=A0AAD6TLF9_9AGAR|nr:hypothetical protein C8F04DRAFT_1227154 [Mycena alexandri]
MSVKDLGSNFTESPKCSDASSRNSVAPTPTAGTLEYEPIAGNLSVIETFKREFFSAKRLYQLDGILRNLDWAVAFQIEALLRNALLHTDELFEQFLPRINQQCRKKGSAYTGRFLQEFQRILRIKDGRESPLACFERILWSFVDNPISFILAKSIAFIVCSITLGA